MPTLTRADYLKEARSQVVGVQGMLAPGDPNWKKLNMALNFVEEVIADLRKQECPSPTKSL